jgi:tRNA U34 5-methylaminomethyl-2-thiouridine-forming methyltransferase MnmC
MDASERGRDDQGSSEPEVRITADGSRTLYDPAVGQTLHSSLGALAEARHVYLEASGVAARLAEGRATRVVEVGLGVGLNLLITAEAAVAGGAQLHVRALDLRLPSAPAVAAMGFDRVVDRELADAWATRLDELRGAQARDPGRLAATLVLGVALVPGVTLELALGGAAAGPQAAPSPAAARLLEPGWAHAVYHDAFSPSATPDLWSDAFLGACARCLAPGGAWVSYTVAGVVRRRLEAHGLEPEKLPGPPGGKREMLRAVRPVG